MKIIISPAKRLEVNVPELADTITPSLPEFLDHSEYLVNKLRKLSIRQLGKMMSVSPQIAELNHERFAKWHTPFTAENAHPALFTFQGDVYRGLDAQSLETDDLEFAQQSLRILSGLYGVIKPLDLIQAYRLEMGTKFPVTPKKKNLYLYWGNTLHNHLKANLDEGEEIINLASNEYFKALKAKQIPNRIINCHFRDLKNGEYKPLTIYMKLARGYMTRFILKNKIRSVEEIKLFDYKNYIYNDRLSTEFDWVFTRDKVEL